MSKTVLLHTCFR